jgi:hypothetical protein
MAEFFAWTLFIDGNHQENDMSELPQVLIGREVCQVLRISERSLRRMRREGLVRCVRVRGALRYIQADVLALLNVKDLRLLHCECDGPCDCPEKSS